MPPPDTAAPSAPASTAAPWSNWSGAARCTPAQHLHPTSEADLCRAIAGTSGPIRVRGTGHSFTPLCLTEGTLIALDAMPGDVLETRRDGETSIARLQAGASLNRLSQALADHGLGFRNLGDIDVQSLAGAALTGTHGTGAALPCLAAEFRGLRLVTADGTALDLGPDADADLFEAARVSLGALGIVTAADVAVRPAYKLHRRVTPRPLRDLLAEAPDLWQRHRHFEFFAMPFCDWGAAIVHDETTAPDQEHHHNDDEASLAQLRLLRTATRRLPWLRRRLLNLALRTTRPEERIGPAHAMLSSVRQTVFHEMEYHLPVTGALDALAEVIHLIEAERPEVFFPIEVRQTAGDTGWLSPFCGGNRISVAVHVHQPDAYDWMFTRLEPIFRRHGGRPHWGKLHSLGADGLRAIYPRFDDFLRLRADLDPHNRFVNAHTARLFGLAPAG